MSFHPYGGSGPSCCPIANFWVSSCSDFQKPSQTATEQGKVKVCLSNFKTKWRGNGMLLGAIVCLIFWNSDHVVLKLSLCSWALPHSAAVWLGFWNSDHVVLKSSIRSSASPRSAAVWLGFWNSDHVVLKSSIRSLASPRLAAVWWAYGTLTMWF